MVNTSNFPLVLDHIGMAVTDIDVATRMYEKLLLAKIIHDEVVTSQGVMVRFLSFADQKIELLQAINDDSPVAKFIAKRGPGIHHLAFKTSDIYEEMQRLRGKGFQILQDEPIKGAYNKLIFFIHPKSMGGTLVEVCQPLAT
ncbi:MAG: methylmalonyl-CoA epimerase [Saprospiraceae bacterium]|nr:methylmalonyl-CoA epimerase [Saprospiraceae bacterium]